MQQMPNGQKGQKAILVQMTVPALVSTGQQKPWTSSGRGEGRPSSSASAPNTRNDRIGRNADWAFVRMTLRGTNAASTNARNKRKRLFAGNNVLAMESQRPDDAPD